MDEHYLELLFSRLESECHLTEGLSDAEFDHIETTHGFRFPPDLRQVLQYRLPTNGLTRTQQGLKWPDWRTESPEQIRGRLSQPLNGILFDIEVNQFWPESWGEKPAGLRDALDVAISRVRRAPVLIPVYSHRFLPAEPSLAGNPVFSVQQTDIVLYGFDLETYFNNEWAMRLPPTFRTEARRIDLWTELVENNNGQDAWWTSNTRASQ